MRKPPGTRIARAGRDARPPAILVPGVIVGIALLILVNLVGLGPSRLAIVAGHVLVALPDHGDRDARRLRGDSALDPGSGRRPRRQRRGGVPPRAAATGAAGGRIRLLLAFLTSFDEFIVAFFLAGTEPTLPLYVWSQLRFPKSLPTVMALGSAILAVSILIAAAAELVRRRGPTFSPRLTTRQRAPQRRRQRRTDR